MDRQSCFVSFVMIGGGLLLLLLIGSIFSRSPPRSEEHFGDVIGAAGEFRQQYFNCLNACEKTDPTKRLSQNPWACGMYCDDIVAKSVAQGRNLGAFLNDSQLCERQCTNSSDSLACRAGCVCARNVDEFCAQQCSHSDIPMCASWCNEIYKTRCAAGNSWFFKTI